LSYRRITIAAGIARRICVAAGLTRWTIIA